MAAVLKHFEIPANTEGSVTAKCKQCTQIIAGSTKVTSISVKHLKIWTSEDRQSLLRSLSKLFIQRDCVEDVCLCFTVFIRNIVEQVRKDIKDLPMVEKFATHQKFCIALSIAIEMCDELVSFTINYLKDSGPFYVKENSITDEPQSKKARKSQESLASRDLVHAVARMAGHMTAELREMWDWSGFMGFLLDPDPDTRWLALLTVSRVFGFSAYHTQGQKSRFFTTDEVRALTLRYACTTDRTARCVELLAKPDQPVEKVNTGLTHTMKGILESDLMSEVVSVCGVILPKLVPPNRRDLYEDSINTSAGKPSSVDPLILVPSTRASLRSLALAVAAGEAVMLEGAVGSGKTALVERLAWSTGRDRVPELLKLQLGDQTDSKALLGTYRCTDVPGEFVWQPGSLTLAVSHGYWILLEDLDYAPMDVISVLAPLLESRHLSLPGHGDLVRAHPDFRIFSTQRLLSGGSGLYKQHSAGCQVLDKMWTKVLVQPLTKEELKQVIIEKYPQLDTVVDRLVEIYLLLASCRHESTSEAMSLEETEVGKYLSRDGRLTSTRDLLKWVSRIATDFDVTATSTANMVFQEALDCFCACLSKPDRRLPLAEAIAAKLNITKIKAEFYMCKYKPAVDISPGQLCVGRAMLPRKQREMPALDRPTSRFAFTRQSVCLLERVAVCVSKCEPVLLVGETGVGKTSSVQYLAEQLGHRLRVINMNQQSDSADLLGGFKPVDLRIVVAPFKEEFELLFTTTFSRKQNERFLGHLQECFNKRRWADLFKLMEHTQKAALGKCKVASEDHQKWVVVAKRLRQLKSQVKETENALAFTFIEGSLVKAMRSGDWVLLDEINLASSETLECLSGLLESRQGSLTLLERGDTCPVSRHPDFRLFACMNPATDVGKKDLPPGLRSRFSELFVDELEDSQELKILVAEYLKGLSLTGAQIDGIVKFYQVVRTEALHKLTDGTGRKPHFSLRTLCRSLQQASHNIYTNVLRSLYEAFCLGFLTQLDRSSHPVVEALIRQHVIGKSNVKGLLKQPLPRPTGGQGEGYLQFEGYWISHGSREVRAPEGYVLTQSVRANLKDLARVVSAGRFPVLLQGETSVGKTSLITWLAQSSGNVCMRINNHEHTDLQEYIGCYAADQTGKLVFQEGVLVQAMRRGHWIILDELNLAPTDVLEALNRLLDDNRELFIPETQETVRAHPHFMLFATQNPPGQYGGRKVLSRAFRNRFIELHFDEIPPTELETILHMRCAIPQSYCKKLVAVLLDLQTRRRGSGVFAGKQGFITLRDLFRWAERYRLAARDIKDKYFDWEQLLADNGYMLLAGRVRKPEETGVIQEVLQKHLKRKVDPSKLFTLNSDTSRTTEAVLKKLITDPPKGFEHIVWTFDMRRMAVLVAQALSFGEPVLLVGETGCGKTTICQLYAHLQGQDLYSVNCHLHTESADFLGGLRPVRHRSEADNSDSPRLFEWCDGPLVSAMKQGGVFLIDEISLADDSVLERLNSVLEPERTLLLAEKGSDGSHDNGGGNQVEQIVAKAQFRVVSTMNPGGDYGKKELSPALRNRFTEIWCPLSQARRDLIQIIEHNLEPGIVLSNQEDGSSGMGSAMMDFVDWFSDNDVGKRVTISIRDLLSWTRFINATAITIQEENQPLPAETRLNRLEPAVAYIHGACLVFLDALASGGIRIQGQSSVERSRSMCLDFLCRQMVGMTGQEVKLSDLDQGQRDGQDGKTCEGYIVITDEDFCIRPFCIPRGLAEETSLTTYALHAPTTCANAQRLLRALQLPRPILLEGSPGVGKTSLVAAVARAAGHQLVRINLSDQTDVSDLFGADLPVEGGEGGQFAWRDGPLLQALKSGDWIVLDELNLASQSVLEGLNACLDHRAEIYVPELSMSFSIQHEKTRIFACQNPLNQGGGRKGLPKSFLNRFTQVYIEPLTDTDLLFITSTMYPQIPTDLLSNMIKFNNKIFDATMVTREWGQRGNPWEFNLRDVFRWAELLIQNQQPEEFHPEEYVGLIYADRMRTEADKSAVSSVYSEIFSHKPTNFNGKFNLSEAMMQVGHSFLERCKGACFNVTGGGEHNLRVLHHLLPYLESLMKCIEMNWMAILVGSSGCGKSSLVHLLASLTGHRLQVLPMNSAMDTTELLGGFEQADIKRHVEDLVQGTRSVLDSLLASVLDRDGSESIQIVTSILQQWERFCATDTKGVTSSSSEELASLSRRVDVLGDFLESLQQIATNYCPSQLDHISQCLDTVKSLATQLHTEVSTHHGGRFEWVDSVLVKALKEGHWLLVENVNFCSPSVLDRLNGLLEPEGVLSINERGVVGEGIPTVRPHPHFRLILTMDPKYGEISRAMRNRGVEIYVLGEADRVPFSDYDVKQMLLSCGLVGKVPCETLMDVQAAVNGTGITNTFSIVDLLRAAKLTNQQLQKGISVGTALLHSCEEVYASTQIDTQARKIIKDLVSNRLTGFDLREWEESHHTSSLLEIGTFPQPIPSVSDWMNSITIATVSQSTVVFSHLIDKLSLTFGQNRQMTLTFTEVQATLLGTRTSETHPFTSVGQNNVEALSYLPYAVQILLESSNRQTWTTLSHWLEHSIGRKLPAKDLEAMSYQMIDGGGGGASEVTGRPYLIDREEGRRLIWIVKNVVEVMKASLETVHEHKLVEEVDSKWREILGTAKEEDLSHLLSYPLDLRWNPQFLKYIGFRLARNRQMSVETMLKFWDYLFSVSNQVLLSVRLTQSQMLHSMGQNEPLSVKRYKRGELNALQVSALLATGGPISTELLGSDCFLHLTRFVQQMDAYLPTVFRTFRDLRDEKYTETLESLSWYERFVWLCQRPLAVSSVGEFVANLCLHWNWLYCKMLTSLQRDYSFPPDLSSTIGSLHQVLGSDHLAAKLQQRLVSFLGHPPPYPSPHMAEGILRLQEVCKMLDIVCKHADRQTDFKQKVSLWLQRGEEIRSVLINAWSLLIKESERTSIGDDIAGDTTRDTGSQQCGDRKEQDMDVEESHDCVLKEVEVTKVIATIENLCRQYNIQSKTAIISPAASSFMTSSAEQEVTCRIDLDLSKEALALWPLVECMQILSQIHILSGIMSGCHGNSLGTRHLLDFQSQNGFVYPQLLVPWKLLSGDSEIVSGYHSDLVLTSLQRLTSVSILRNPRLWLEWGTQGMDDSDWTTDKCSVMHTMCSAVFSSNVFHLLIGGIDSQSKSPAEVDIWLPGNITLQGVDSKLTQLQSLKKTLFRHLGTVGSKQWDLRYSLFNMATHQLQYLLNSVAMVTVPENLKPTVAEAIYQMVSATNEQEVNKISHILRAFPTDSVDPLFPEFNQVLTPCLMTYGECVNHFKSEQEKNTDIFSQMISLGQFLAYAGLLQAFLLAPQGPVDPAHKVAVKLEYTKQELRSIEREMFVRNWQHQVQTGLELDCSGCDQHPHLTYLVRRREELTEQVKVYSQQKAYRPTPQQFDSLLRDSRQFLSTVASVTRVTGILGKLKDAHNAMQGRVEESPHVLREVSVWAETAEEFVRRCQNNYPLYKDLYTPVLAGITQIQSGLQMASCSVQMQHRRHEMVQRLHTGTQATIVAPQSPGWLESSLETLCRVPFTRPGVCSSLEWVCKILSEECLGVIRAGMDDDMESGRGHGTVRQMTARVLKASLHLSKTYAMMRETLDPPSLRTLSSVFTHYLSSWQQQEQERHRKEEEDASLYKYKERSHGNEMKEQEQEEHERSRRFPSYAEDFEDIKVGFTLDDSAPLIKDSGLSDSEPSDLELEVIIGEDEMFDICQVQKQVFSGLTSSSWYRSQRSESVPPTEVDYIEPTLLCYQVGAKLGRIQARNMVQHVDCLVFGGHLVTGSVLQKCGAVDTNSVFKKRQDSKPYDIYYDPNVPEVLQCRPLLEAFRTRVCDLLAEWTDHPTLKELMTVIDRMMSFPVTSPLMKFVTGLEVLIHKAEEWESNAARHVSVKEHIEAVTHRVILWRKLELQGWKTCLDGEMTRVERRAAKWWFYLYQLVREFIEEKTVEQPSDGPPHSEILKSLQTFMEKSTLGEFKVRLDLVHAFLGHLINMDASVRQELVVRVLWNVHTYYGQFAVAVQQRITQLRNPIEKELKSFVKIAQWNDRNFYSLKQAVQKTHKTLHKHMREFQSVLSQPVQQVLTDSQPDWLVQSEARKPSQGHTGSHDAFLMQITCQSLPSDLPLTEGSLLMSLPGLGRKYGKHVSTVLTGSRLEEMCGVLDQFTTELIESVCELQNLNVNTTATKEKQKSEAKHIQQRKRKALTDLFKYLHTLGLSYRKGLMAYQSCQSDQKLLPPLDIGATLEQRFSSLSSAADEITMVTWEGCQKYQTRCVARNALLTAALTSPSKELGPGNIDRCKGFTAHLATWVTQQWEDLARDWETFTHLRKEVQRLGCVAQSSGDSVNQKEAAEYVQLLSTACNEALEFSAQLKLIFQCFPESQSYASGLISPLPDEQVARLLTSCQSDEIWQTSFEKLTEMEATIVDMKKRVKNLSQKVSQWVSQQDIEVLKKDYHQLTGVIEIMHDLEEKLVKPDSGEHNCISESVKFMQMRIQRVVQDFYVWESHEKTSTDVSDNSNSEFLIQSACDKSEELVKQVLLAVQGLVKYTEDSKGQDQSEEEGLEDDLQEGHLTEHLLKGVQKQIGKLRLTEVSAALDDLFTVLTSQVLASTTRAVRQVLAEVLPLVHQYSLLAQYFITQQVRAFRGSAKLLSVLLGIFSELAQKGFCLPAEFSDEVEGEGATEFKDIEGGGLGQGEGVKDVSDQIESEDQLDEAQKAGENKEEDSEQPDIKSEENAIEMSEDFEGKMQDMEQGNAEEEEEEQQGEEEQEMDKQMGDLQGEGETEKLDEQLWGSDGEEEENQQTKEEFGDGAGNESHTELVAKDDNPENGKQDKEEQKKQDMKEDMDEREEAEDKVNEQPDVDQSEFNEDESDPYHSQQTEDKNQPEPMQLPDDLDLDGEGQGESEGEEEEQTEGENPFDIDNMSAEAKELDPEEMEESEAPESGEKDAEEKREEGDSGDDGKAGEGEEEHMDIEEEQDGDTPNMEKGVEPQEDPELDVSEGGEDKNPKQEADDVPQAAEHAGKTSHDTQEVQQVQEARDSAGKSENEQQETQGVGVSESKTQEGHQGDDKSLVTSGNSQQMDKRTNRKPGQSKEDQSLGSRDEQVEKRLKTVDTGSEAQQNDNDERKQDTADLYEHIRDASAHYDTQTMDVATSEQQDEQKEAAVAGDEDEWTDGEDDNEGDDVQPMEEQTQDTSEEVEKLTSAKNKSNQPETAQPATGKEDEEREGEMVVEGERVVTAGVSRGEEASVHTVIENLDYTPGELDIEKLRQELEEELHTWSQMDNQNAVGMTEPAAVEAWQKYEAVTAALSQELCEQLRLVLEPTQASKLRGDYRTGKRLNMRKVIPYIASQFRKDKIWLRRTKPSKRNYQVVVAVDDSSSMADNHSRQLAFESLATIANALTLLEVGQLSVCSFGESVQELHPFHEQFGNQSGAKLLQRFSFEQKKTKIAQLLNHMTAMLVKSRSYQSGSVANLETCQLLLIVSDGRGLFLEGVDTVKRAVRQAREASVFTVFVILDNPQNKDSILDIRVPVFRGPGQMPEIRSYMDHFPFPFYLILRDVNVLPQVLSDALRQWFELVTAGDR